MAAVPAGATSLPSRGFVVHLPGFIPLDNDKSRAD